LKKSGAKNFCSLGAAAVKPPQSQVKQVFLLLLVHKKKKPSSLPCAESHRKREPDFPHCAKILPAPLPFSERSAITPFGPVFGDGC
jgi:hypothetical protein